MGCNQSHIESENERSLRAHLTHTKTNNGKFTLSCSLGNIKKKAVFAWLMYCVWECVLNGWSGGLGWQFEWLGCDALCVCGCVETPHKSVSNITDAIVFARVQRWWCLLFYLTALWNIMLDCVHVWLQTSFKFPLHSGVGQTATRVGVAWCEINR